MGHAVAEGGEGVVGGALERDGEVGGVEVAGDVGRHGAPALEEFLADEVEAETAEEGQRGGLDALEEGEREGLADEVRVGVVVVEAVPGFAAEDEGVGGEEERGGCAVEPVAREEEGRGEAPAEAWAGGEGRVVDGAAAGFGGGGAAHAAAVVAFVPLIDAEDGEARVELAPVEVGGGDEVGVPEDLPSELDREIEEAEGGG